MWCCMKRPETEHGRPRPCRQHGKVVVLTGALPISSVVIGQQVAFEILGNFTAHAGAKAIFSDPGERKSAM